VTIRTFQPGDETVQAAIYNEAAADLPRFKPATLPEIQRRTRARDFDPSMRLVAEENGRPVGYAVFNPNGRVSYPWCRKGCEAHAEPLFQRVLDEMRKRGFRQAFAAYRADWPATSDFFLKHGFTRAREMVSFMVGVIDLPTVAARPSTVFSPLRKEDIPALLQMSPAALRIHSAPGLERYLFANPYFVPEAVFVLRSRTGDATPVAVGILVQEPTYADPRMLDADMPCFRLGAFGTEGMQAKRVKGLFSFLTAPGPNANALGLDLLAHAATLLEDTDDIDTLAAQVPSDVPHLLRFYQMNFRRQGSFPVFELPLAGQTPV
jgi:hypothetical protein